MRQIAFTAREQAELVDVPDWNEPLKPDEVRGRTLVSLVSPGTELNWGYLGDWFPVYPGYASVFEVEEVGCEVTGIKPGMVVFSSGTHSERQRAAVKTVLPVPTGLQPETAVFARLMGVSMTTLNTAAAHPPARVLITGLGPVGNLAAQIFSHCGYEVTAIDPVEARRRCAVQVGLSDVRAGIQEDLIDKVALHLECSGYEGAALEGCKCVQKRGEVVLIGVPWRQRSDAAAFELLHAVFHRYVVLRSGWEWEIPREPKDFAFHSISGNYAAALDWLRTGKIKTGPLAASYPPSEAQKVYNGLLKQTLPAPAAILDWRKC